MKLKMFLSLYFLMTGANIPSAFPAESAEDVIQMLHSEDWHVRDRGISFAEGFLNNDRVKIELIKLLERENQGIEKDWIKYEQSLSKDSALPADYLGVDAPSGEYGLYLAELVARLKDLRSIRSLVGTIELEGTITEVLVGFGEPAIEPLIEGFKNNKKKASKPAIVTTLDAILRTKKIDPTDRNKVKKMFLEDVTVTKNQVAKKNMVSSFDNFYDDDEVLSIVESLAASDTFYVISRVKGRPRAERVKVFPIKEEAEKALGRIRAKRNEKHQELPSGATPQSKTR